MGKQVQGDKEQLSSRRFGILRVTAELLRGLLYLPGDTVFYQLGDLLETREADIFEFLISHPGLPICPPGERPPVVYPGHRVTVSDEPGQEIEFIDWGVE